MGMTFDPMAFVWLGVLGVGGVVAFLGLLTYILLTVVTVFFGKSNAGKPMEDWGVVQAVATSGHSTGAALTGNEEAGEHKTPGTMVLVLILLVSFIVYYFANWKALADVWPVR